MILSGAILFATLSVAAEPRPKVAEVGDAVRVTVSVAGTGLSQVQSVTPPKMPPGLEIGPAQGPKIERRIEVLNRQQVQSERLIWYFDLTATRPGSFLVPGFTASNGNEVAMSLPFTLEATGTFDARDYAFVETEVDPRPRYVGEPITVALKIGIDVGVIEDLVDAESLVVADWMFEGLGGAGAAPESDPFPAPGTPGVSQVRTTAGKILNLAEAPPESRKEGRFATLVARRRFVASRPGTVTVGPTAFRAVIGRNFERDLFGTTRIPRDRKLALVNAPDVELQVKPLPDAGRGDSFSGLVGRLALDVQAAAAGASAGAATAPIRVKVGDSLRVSVRVSGDGNVATTPLPRVEIDGFKRFGVVEAVDAKEENPSRTLVYDIAPTSTEVKQIPPFTFEVFDTATGTYRQLSSKPIALQVLPGAAISNLAPASTPAPAGGEHVRDRAPSIVTLFPGGATGLVAVFALPALALGALSLVGRLRKSGDAAAPPERGAAPAKRPIPAPPAPARVPSGLTTFAAALAALPADETERAKAIAEAFARHLATLAGASPEAFVGADLDLALARHVKDRTLRRAAQEIVDEAERTAFGGAPLSRDLPERAAQVVARLERAMR